MRIIIVLFLFLFAMQESQASNTTKIDKLIEKVDPDVNIGIKITNLSQNKEVYSLNAGRYFVFGSALKVIPILGILDYYGRDYKFTTYITIDQGNLYLHINDPDFSSDDLKSLVRALKTKLNGKQVQNFYIVKDEFTLPDTIREKVIADSAYCYGAQITKTHINKNCIRVTAAPTEIGKNVKISYNEVVPYKIDNRAVTVSKSTWDRVNTSIEGDKLSIFGTLSQATGTATISAVVPDGARHLQHMTKEFLNKEGLKIKGKVLISSTSNKGRVLVSYSKGFAEIATKAMVKSDNFMTDYLLADYATKYKANQWRKATYYLKQLIKNRFAVDLSDSTIHDGSGLSRGNIMTVEHFNQFLAALSKREDFEELKNMFCVPGGEGTMKNRLNGEANIYAKTGTLTNVTALIGYYYNSQNELHSFVIVINNYFGSKKKYTDLIDDIVRTAKGEIL